MWPKGAIWAPSMKLNRGWPSSLLASRNLAAVHFLWATLSSASAKCTTSTGSVVQMPLHRSREDSLSWPRLTCVVGRTPTNLQSPTPALTDAVQRGIRLLLAVRFASLRFVCLAFAWANTDAGFGRQQLSCRCALRARNRLHPIASAHCCVVLSCAPPADIGTFTAAHPSGPSSVRSHLRVMSSLST